LLQRKTSLDFASNAPEFVFPKNTFSFGIFLRNCTSPIFMAKWTIWQDPRHNCSGVKFRSLEKTRFLSEFFYETAPSPIFGAKRTIWRVWGKNCSGRKLRLILPRKLRNRFSHKQVFGSNFFTKPPPHLFSGPNGLYGAFGGKIFPDENFAQFCLKSPGIRFSQKHLFDPNFFTKPHLTNFQGQTQKHIFSSNFFTKLRINKHH
jgi:hypothetical protein